MSKLKLFFLSLVLTTGALLVVFYVNHVRTPVLVPIADDLYLTSQLKPENILPLRRRGIKTIVDMRPDGEAKDQPPSSKIESASKQLGLDFHYIPVPHESLPESAVD